MNIGNGLSQFIRIGKTIKNFWLRLKKQTKSWVWSQNLVALIFTKTTFTKHIAHILSNSRSSRPIRTPLKSINHASKYCIYEKFHYFGAQFNEIRHVLP